jgi:hypothetical protein
VNVENLSRFGVGGSNPVPSSAKDGTFEHKLILK